MILIKYTLNQVFKNQLIILMLLFLVCICQKLIKILGLENNVSILLIILYLSLNIPELGKLLIPFSLFLSVIITYYRLHMHNEILAMYSCGINKYILMQSVLLCSIIISCIAFINLSWICPYCKKYQDHISFEIRKNTHFNINVDKKFQLFSNKNLVLLVDTINGKKLNNIFMASKQKNKYNNIINVITAKQGVVCNNLNNFQSIILNTGTYYKIQNNQKILTEICITNFAKYQISIDCKFDDLKKIHETTDYMSMNQLWNSPLSEAQIEFNWRLTLLMSIFIMPIIALLLVINISYQYSSSFLLSMILYITFFILHILLRFYYISSSINSIIWIWLINLFYLILICLINFKEKILERYFFLKIN